MSEVKGTLLGIVLAISVFSIVFGIMTVTIKRASNTVADRIDETAEVQPDVFGQVSTAYELHY